MIDFSKKNTQQYLQAHYAFVYNRYTFEPQQYDTIGYSRKVLQSKKKKKLFFYPSHCVATKPTD